jgi:hypothetical protein
MPPKRIFINRRETATLCPDNESRLGVEMLRVHKAGQRGHANHGWLDTWHSFSFADYHDPARMGFGPLRVINEDWVQPGAGFPTHGHRDMEIVTYVLEGELAHEDSMGNGSTIRPGDVQRMSAGKGVLHSEFNHAADAVTHLLQIWILPSVRGTSPSYEQRHIPVEEKRGRLRLIASPNGDAGSVRIQQDAAIYAGLFDDQERATHALAAGRRAYVQVARGRLCANGQVLDAGDALEVEGEAEVVLERGEGAEVLLFDLP